LLLDDLFAELDEMRGKKAISLFSQSCQIFITGTTADYMALKPFLEKEGEFDPLFVQQGKVNKQT
jgi:recombinational DNA repair ATPase RecF